MDTSLSTIEECTKAKAVLDPTNTVAVGLEKTATVPSGCSIWKGRWFFNIVKGKLDGVSEPVCKNVTTISKTATTIPASSTPANTGRFAGYVVQIGR